VNCIKLQNKITQQIIYHCIAVAVTLTSEVVYNKVGWFGVQLAYRNADR